MLTRWYGIFGWLWCLPATLLIFLFYIGPMWLFRQYRFIRRHGWLLEFEVVPNSWVREKFWNKWGGVCCAAIIVYRSEYKDHEIVVLHERQHALQNFYGGIFQWFLYIGHSLFIYFFQKEKHAYLDNWFERDARRAAGQKVDLTPEEWFEGPSDRWPWW